MSSLPVFASPQIPARVAIVEGAPFPLLGNGTSDRKAWMENRIEELAQIIAAGGGGFPVMDKFAWLSEIEGLP
jgi:hypothetical protein